MSIKKRIKTRKEFVSMILNIKILDSPLDISQAQENSELDLDFLQQLANAYTANREKIKEFIAEKIRHKLLDELQQTIICCGICELVIGADRPLVIKEYMIISDKYGSNAALVNAALDLYYKTYIEKVATD